MSDVKIVYASEEYIKSFYKTLDFVAKERIYIETVDVPPLDKVTNFQKNLISKSAPIYYAIDNENVVGWCDICPLNNPRQKHRGGLGMGLLPEYRGEGLGSKLLESSIIKAKEFGLEKIELYVYTNNKTAISLYEKFGFVTEGIIKHYRKLDNEYYDCLSMAKFI